MRPTTASYFENGQGASLTADGKIVGAAGKISGEVLGRWDIKQKNILFAQIDMEGFYRRQISSHKYIPVPEFPSISRDISLAAPKDISADDIKRIIGQTVDGQKEVILTEIKFLEKYEGDKIPPQHRGMVFSLTYRASAARTLRDDEATKVHHKVCEALIQELRVIQR
jgi:phenylalanyl-tRNA synthetase beta chain